MGKTNKMSKDASRPAGTAAAAASAGAAPAPGAAAAAATYLDSLTPEEQEQERKKQELRDKKAQEAKQRQEQEVYERQKWEQAQRRQQVQVQRVEKKHQRAHQSVLQKAKAEGVLEAVENEDGYWYVDLGKDTWKLVQDTYWCTHCEASLNDSNLESHLTGDRHKKKMAWAGTYSSTDVPQVSPPMPGSAAPAAPPPRQAPPSAAPAAPGLQVWQEYDPVTMVTKCKACNKNCDGIHENTTEHNKRVENFMWHLDADKAKYEEPKQPFLAWVEDEGFGAGRYLRCLLCKKWVQDHDGLSTDNYKGNHGDAGISNQKDHAKKLANLEDYLQDLKREKAIWHPPKQRAQPQAATPAPWAAGGAAAAAAPTGPPVAPPILPPPWTAFWCGEQKKFYYFDGHTTTWEAPVAPGPPPQARQAAAPAAPSFDAGTGGASDACEV